MGEYTRKVIDGREMLVGANVTPAQQAWAMRLGRLARADRDAAYGVLVTAVHLIAEGALQRGLHDPEKAVAPIAARVGELIDMNLAEGRRH